MVSGGRTSGKTVWLVLESAKRNAPIVVSTKERAESLKNLAAELGVSIPEPIIPPKRERGFTFAGVIVDDIWRVKC